jgi:prepilin-type N-terminal cleavage/methylation domain-containing protein
MQNPAAATESSVWAVVRRRLAADDGYTMTEMLVVLAILVVVLGSLTTLFVSASRAELELTRRVEAQQNARLALDSLRNEIHCARALTPASATAVSSITLTLGAYCPTNRGTLTTALTTISGSGTYNIIAADTSAFPSAAITVAVGASGSLSCTGNTSPTTLTGCTRGVIGTYPAGSALRGTANYTWCTKDKAGAVATAPGAGAPYSLWRYGGTSCSGTGRKVADHLTTHLVFTAYTAPVAGYLGTLGVTLPVDLTPADPMQRYTLTDDVVLRNSGRP